MYTIDEEVENEASDVEIPNRLCIEILGKRR